MRNNQNMVQISNSHRLIQYIENLNEIYSTKNNQYISIDYFSKIIQELLMDYNRIVNTRRDIVIKKAKQKTKKPAPIDFFIELLCDPYFFRNTKNYVDCNELKI